MKRFPRIRTTLVAVMLAASSAETFALSERYSAIEEGVKQIIEQADWNSLKVLEIDLGDHSYTPSHSTLQRGQAYLMRLKNVGKYAHNMVGGTFFKAIVVKSVATDAGRVEAPFLKSVYVRPKQQVDLLFVPTRAGTFTYYCSIEGHLEQGMAGEFVIE